MNCFEEPLSIPVEMYLRWMKTRKSRMKARYYRKFNRMEKRYFKLRGIG